MDGLLLFALLEQVIAATGLFSPSQIQVAEQRAVLRQKTGFRAMFSDLVGSSISSWSFKH